MGPQLSLAGSGIGGGGIKNFLGNWGSSVAGSQLGGGLGSMLFGPWGALLGAIFGQGVGRRGWKARQTPKKETWKDIAFGENTLLSNLLNKKKTPTGEGLGGIDLSQSNMRDKIYQEDPGAVGIENKFDRRGDDRTLMAGVKDMSTSQQLRFHNLDMQNKLYQGNSIGEPLTPEEEQELEQLRNLRNSGLISAEGNPIA